MSEKNKEMTPEVFAGVFEEHNKIMINAISSFDERKEFCILLLDNIRLRMCDGMAFTSAYTTQFDYWDDIIRKILVLSYYISTDVEGGVVNYIEYMMSKSKEILIDRAGQYSGNSNDRLHNFNQANRYGMTSIKFAYSLMMKQYISLVDIANGIVPATQELIEEKTVDTINYLLFIKILIQKNNEE